MTAEHYHAKESQAGEGMQADVYDSSRTRTAGTDPLNIALPGSSDSAEGVSSVDQNFDYMLEQFQPQHWLTPASLPRDQWDTWIANTTS